MLAVVATVSPLDAGLLELRLFLREEKLRGSVRVLADFAYNCDEEDDVAF